MNISDKEYLELLETIVLRSFENRKSFDIVEVNDQTHYTVGQIIQIMQQKKKIRLQAAENTRPQTSVEYFYNK